MDLGLSEPTLNVIKAIIIMDQDGHRIIARYYDSTGPLANEKAFEKMLFSKMGAAEVCMLEGLTCVHRYVLPESSSQNVLKSFSTLSPLRYPLSHAHSVYNTRLFYQSIYQSTDPTST